MVYNWFGHLKEKGHYLNAYVIMPNHLHLLVSFRNTGKTINSIISNGKRFMAYDIVKRLQNAGQEDVLLRLANAVTRSDKTRGKIHQVFEPSFDCKECFSRKFILQKLNYIHNNPCRGKWRLTDSPEKYLHSSALYYKTGEHGLYSVVDYSVMQDIDLTK